MWFVSGCQGAEEGQPLSSVDFSVKVFAEGTPMDSATTINLSLGAFEA